MQSLNISVVINFRFCHAAYYLFIVSLCSEYAMCVALTGLRPDGFNAESFSLPNFFFISESSFSRHCSVDKLQSDETEFKSQFASFASNLISRIHIQCNFGLY